MVKTTPPVLHTLAFDLLDVKTCAILSSTCSRTADQLCLRSITQYIRAAKVSNAFEPWSIALAVQGKNVSLWRMMCFERFINGGPPIPQKNVEWAAAHFGLTSEDVRADDNYVLRFACAIGHLELAQWVSVHFGLTAADARANHNTALRQACAYGHVGTAKWLTAHFGLTAKDVRSDNNWAFCNACKYGNLESAQWMATHFGLTAADARCCNNWALRLAYWGGYSAVVRWLVLHFGLTDKEMINAGVDPNSVRLRGIGLYN